MSVVCSHLDEALLVPTQAVGASKAVSARRLAERLFRQAPPAMPPRRSGRREDVSDPPREEHQVIGVEVAWCAKPFA